MNLLRRKAAVLSETKAVKLNVAQDETCQDQFPVGGLCCDICMHPPYRVTCM